MREEKKKMFESSAYNLWAVAPPVGSGGITGGHSINI